MGPRNASAHANMENNSGPKGLYGQYLNEGDLIPEWKRSGGDIVYQSNNNSFIVMGRDRPGHAAEGAGGRGETSCGYIDLVAGLGGHDHIAFAENIHKKNQRSLSDDEKERDPNFFTDAARVYITQRGSIDYYFGLAQGSETQAQAKNKSAVGLKADHVRIVAREHLKLVVGKARLQNAGMSGERNSGGGVMEYPGKIDFIAGNYTDDDEASLISFLGGLLGGKPIKKLQPLVKGDNLVQCLGYVFDQLNEFVQCFFVLDRALVAICNAINLHTHPVVGLGAGIATPGTGGILTAPIFKDVAELLTRINSSNFNLGAQGFNYLNSKNTAKYICSRNVNTT